MNQTIHDKNEERHEQTLFELVKRVSKKYPVRYLGVSLHEKYSRNGYNGEMDLRLLTRTSNGVWHNRYYEVKGRHSPIAMYRAKQQFERHKKAHPGESWKYIYVTPEKVLRYDGWG